MEDRLHNVCPIHYGDHYKRIIDYNLSLENRLWKRTFKQWWWTIPSNIQKTLTSIPWA